MSEDIYAKPDLTKKVRFQTGVKEDRNTDVCDDVDNVRIYDNYWAEESPPQDNSQDNTTEDPQQIVSVDVSSGKRSLPRAAVVLLGLLCLLLLVAVIVLGVLFTLERNRLWADNAAMRASYSKMKSLNANLTSERDGLQTRYSEMKSLNANLTSERDGLQTHYSEMKSLNANLTQKTSQLEATNNNLTKERDELQKLIETTYCPDDWIKFGRSCYLMPTSKKNWKDSNTFCEQYDAQLVIISNKEEQMFFSSFKQAFWIGLTDEESEKIWKWVDETALTLQFWRPGQPDNWGKGENCAVISTDSKMNNWNDLSCSSKSNFICEKMLK